MPVGSSVWQTQRPVSNPAWAGVSSCSSGLSVGSFPSWGHATSWACLRCRDRGRRLVLGHGLHRGGDAAPRHREHGFVVFSHQCSLFRWKQDLLEIWIHSRKNSHTRLFCVKGWHIFVERTVFLNEKELE